MSKKQQQQETKIIKKCFDKVVSEDTDIVFRIEKLAKKRDSIIFMTEKAFRILESACMKKFYVITWKFPNTADESYEFSQKGTDDALFYVSRSGNKDFSRMICLKYNATKAYMLSSDVD